VPSVICDLENLNQIVNDNSASHVTAPIVAKSKVRKYMMFADLYIKEGEWVLWNSKFLFCFAYLPLNKTLGSPRSLAITFCQDRTV
jgi:hypothetical protein